MYGSCPDLVIQLSDNLNVALANDATGQATITDYKNQVAELKSQQKLAGQSKTAPETITATKLTSLEAAKQAAAQKAQAAALQAQATQNAQATAQNTSVP